MSLTPHITREEKKHIMKIKAENTPVLTLKLSVGSFSEDVSVVIDCLGENQMIRRTKSGKIMPIAIIRDGVVVISFKKQITNPTMQNIITANVPLPIPNTSP